MSNLPKASDHPSDQELLLVADRECSPRRAAKVRRHLLQCPRCHHRVTELENTLADFVALHGEQVESPASPQSHARFRARLQESVRLAELPRSSFPSGLLTRQLAAACIALLVVGVGAWAMHTAAFDWFARQAPDARMDATLDALPRRILTPGAFRQVAIDDLCSNRIFENDPPVNSTLEQAVLREYGLAPSSKSGYKLDYLISPTLGGTEEIHNLWPEPDASTSWDAQAKDALENHLHALVCEGKLPLSTAQKEISTDWIAAYKRYFHTSVPLSGAAAIASQTFDGATPQETAANRLPAL